MLQHSKLLVLLLVLVSAQASSVIHTRLVAQAYQPAVLELKTQQQKSLHFLNTQLNNVEDVRKFNAIIQAESSWNPAAYNAQTGDSCLLQVNNKTWADDAEKLGLDYKNNIEDCLRMGIYIKEVQGWSAWDASKSKWNKKSTL